MRIVSGRYRGRKLVSPEGLTSRPTLDRVKENLFNLLPEVSGQRVLDLFSGAGGLGLEALSRGAASVDFCDSSAEAVRFLKRNLERMEGEVRIHACDYSSALARCAAEGRKFGLVLLDPPYREGFYEPVCRELRSRGLLAEEGILAAESQAALAVPFEDYGYEIWKERRYGGVRLTLLKEKKS